jgi:hypothetical protein
MDAIDTCFEVDMKMKLAIDMTTKIIKNEFEKQYKAEKEGIDYDPSNKIIHDMIRVTIMKGYKKYGRKFVTSLFKGDAVANLKNDAYLFSMISMMADILDDIYK